MKPETMQVTRKQKQRKNRLKTLMHTYHTAGLVHNGQPATNGGKLKSITQLLAPGTKPRGTGTMTRPTHSISAPHPDLPSHSSQYQTPARSPGIYVSQCASDTRTPHAEAYERAMQDTERTPGVHAAMAHICPSRRILGTGCRYEGRADDP